MSRPLAILISDIHLSLKAPRCRANEPDWLEAQARSLREIIEVSDRLKIPVVCAGDVFDRYDPSPELVNYAIDELPFMYAVAGNHDLPYHNLGAIQTSAYWTLVKAGKLSDLTPGKFHVLPGFIAYGFPFGVEITTPDDHCVVLKLAVVHDYCWDSGDRKTGFPGAPIEKSAKEHAKKLKGYDIALFGDNHVSSDYQANKGLWIHNHGNLIRRTVDECKRIPTYSVLLNDGTVERVELESAKADLFTIEEPEGQAAEEEITGMEEFVRSLENSPDSRFDFRLAVVRYVAEHQPSLEVRKLLRKILQDKGK